MAAFLAPILGAIGRAAISGAARAASTNLGRTMVKSAVRYTVNHAGRDEEPQQAEQYR